VVLQTLLEGYFFVRPAINALSSKLCQMIRCARGDPSSFFSCVLFHGSYKLFRLSLVIYDGVL